jgi:serine O-acetyltransferase
MKSVYSPIQRPQDNFFLTLHSHHSKMKAGMPSLKDTQKWTKDMVNFLFPVKADGATGPAGLEEGMDKLMNRLTMLLGPLEGQLKHSKEDIVSQLFNRMPDVYDLLLADAATFLRSDPAAESIEEVILCYPGFLSLIIHRIAHVLYELNVPVLPRVMNEYVHGKTGIDIHPGAVIGRNCFIDHGTGIVIGETTSVGNHVKIYQGVTLGAMAVSRDLSGTKRHPTIEDNVILYAGCTILGGETVIGHDTIIGGNVWLTESVLPNSVVYRENKVIVRDSKSLQGEINFII